MLKVLPPPSKRLKRRKSRLLHDEEFNLHVLELRAIRRALKQTSNNRTEAARLLGISRRTLQRKLKDLEHSG